LSAAWQQVRRTAQRAGSRVSTDPLLLGLVGSVLMAGGAVGIGTLPKADPLSAPSGVYLLRSYAVTRPVATALVLAGVALMLAAWLAVGREVRSGTGSPLAGCAPCSPPGRRRWSLRLRSSAAT
jgi:hypothetical protein